MSNPDPFRDTGSYDTAYDAPYEPDVEVMSPRRPAQGIYGFAETKLMSLAEDGKSELVRNFDGLVAMVQELAAKVESAGGGIAGDYAHQAADMLSELQATLRDKPVAELLDDGRDLIRRSPGLAIGVAVIAGFAAARLVKAGQAS